MEYLSNGSRIENATTNASDWNDGSTNVLRLVSMTIACVGIISNLTVVVVFVNHKKIRHKIPIVYIINQVSFLCKDK